MGRPPLFESLVIQKFSKGQTILTSISTVTSTMQVSRQKFFILKNSENIQDLSLQDSGS